MNRNKENLKYPKINQNLKKKQEKKRERKYFGIITFEDSCNVISLAQILSNNTFSYRIQIISYLDNSKTFFMCEFLQWLNQLVFLDLSFNPDTQINEKIFSKLAESILTLKKLKYLTINLNLSQDVKYKDIFSKHLDLSKQQDLIQIKLKICNIKQQEIEGPESISQNLENLSQQIDIQDKIIFSVCEYFDDQIQVFKLFCEGQNLQNYLDYRLLNGVSLCNDHLKEKSNTMSQNIHLQKVMIEFKQNSQVTKKGLKYLKQFLKNFQNIQTFSIFTEELNSIVPRQLNLVEDLYGMNLEKIEIFLKNNNKIQLQCYSFGEQISKFTQLKQLIIVNENAYLLLNLDKNLLNLTNLKQLKLVGVQLSQKFILSLLSRNTNLRILFIKYDQYYGVKYLMEQLKQKIFLMKQLQYLYIDFGLTEDRIQVKCLNYFKRKNVRLVEQRFKYLQFTINWDDPLVIQ